MTQPIIATGLSGVVFGSEPWKKAYQEWFKKASEKLGKPEIKDYSRKPGYSRYVDKVMRQLKPEASEEERVVEARKRFFDNVCRQVSLRADYYKNQEVIGVLNHLKKYYRLALITTLSHDAVSRILSISKLQGLYNIIECGKPEEKDDKADVFNRFLRYYGKPLLYIGGDNKQSFDYCKKNKIPCLFANLRGGADMPGVESVHNAEELRKLVEEISE